MNTLEILIAGYLCAAVGTFVGALAAGVPWRDALAEAVRLPVSAIEDLQAQSHAHRSEMEWWKWFLSGLSAEDRNWWNKVLGGKNPRKLLTPAEAAGIMSPCNHDSSTTGSEATEAPPVTPTSETSTTFNSSATSDT